MHNCSTVQKTSETSRTIHTRCAVQLNTLQLLYVFWTRTFKCTVALHLFIITIYFMFLFDAIALLCTFCFYERVGVRSPAKICCHTTYNLPQCGCFSYTVVCTDHMRWKAIYLGYMLAAWNTCDLNIICHTFYDEALVFGRMHINMVMFPQQCNGKTFEKLEFKCFNIVNGDKLWGIFWSTICNVFNPKYFIIFTRASSNSQIINGIKVPFKSLKVT